MAAQTLGRATLSRIIDIDPFALPFAFLLPEGNIDALRHESALLSPHHVDFETDTILLGLHSFVLRVGGLTILIDTCVGEHKPRPRRADWHERRASGYMERLAADGLTPADIDIVMCTHLHADHVGWNTRLENGKWVPTFPNARYVMGRHELDHWLAEEAVASNVHNHGAFADSVRPVLDAGLAEPVDDGFALSRGLDILPLPGHSPGQIGLLLNCGGGEQALFCGDAIHSPVQVFHPGWNSAFCHDPALAASQRRDLVTRAANDDLLLFPAHLRMADGMRVRRDGDDFRPIFS